MAGSTKKPRINRRRFQLRAKNIKTFSEALIMRKKAKLLLDYYATVKNLSATVLKSLKETLSNIQTTLVFYSGKARVGRQIVIVSDEDKTERAVKARVRADIVYANKDLMVDNKLVSIVMEDSEVIAIMQDILREAKQLAPIDKKYVGNYLDGKGKRRKIRSMHIEMPIMKPAKKGDLINIKDLVGVKTNGRTSGITGQRNIRSYEFSLDYRFKSFDIGSETETSLSREKQKYIEKLGTNNRRLLWFKESEKGGTIVLSKKRRLNKEKRNEKNLKDTDFKGSRIIATLYHDNKMHGGEEELRRSGKFDKKFGIISFNPMRLGTKTDYAKKQHEDTNLQHLPGKEDHFLSKAYTHNRTRLIAAVEKVLKNR